MKAVVIGLGSMGRRRIRLLKSLRPSIRIIGVDCSSERCAEAERELGVDTGNDLDRVLSGLHSDCALVCTSPVGHGPLVMKCLGAGCHVFTELNLLSDWYEGAIRTAKRKKLKLFVSSTFLYRREPRYIAKTVGGRRVNYIYHSGQYLPDWHPWEDYRSFFVADPRTNACREIFAIELPWLIKAFGPVESVEVMTDRNSGLDISFNDNYMVMIRHKSGSKGVFCQDIISRKGLRRLEVFSEKLHLFWDGTPDSLTVYDIRKKQLKPVFLYTGFEQRSGYNENIIEDMYRDELKAFLSYVGRGRSPEYTLEDDREVLSLIDCIEGVKRV